MTKGILMAVPDPAPPPGPPTTPAPAASEPLGPASPRLACGPHGAAPAAALSPVPATDSLALA
eukprot:CAMPEP_0206011708 /NCGR_PEP_ID=MMETSP1464-20131121/13694_1 /ASSEMBLY_ACC=CAM_ASM_001124 /TAXON_ID=119497 /ORGANISM="Exanthemachrysis gayraliae, Strain RCC1523" /LENGTH=62 /DNA_ID=CAMNT_0053385387 /DNA_START=97 /DNA_END=281 /DNA_ORIENTATION=-